MSGVNDRGEITPVTAAAHELKAPLALVRQLALRLQDDPEHLSSSESMKLLQHIALTSERPSG